MHISDTKVINSNKIISENIEMLLTIINLIKSKKLDLIKIEF